MYLDTFLFSKKKLRRSTFTCINENKVAFIPSVQNGGINAIRLFIPKKCALLLTRVDTGRLT
jgi:hypothetical protein